MNIPRVIANRFRVECEIGRGGMGTVYRATHLGLDRPVAIKILKPEFAADPEVGERFMREARTMAKLRHTGAAMIFDAGRLPDGRPFIVMEFVEGATLAETLDREGRLSSQRAVRIACEICDVLAEAHALGIVHRDLKPSNIMLRERGICVLDFGIAKVLATSADVTKTHATTESGLIIGTPRYMSPEQCLGQAVGPASDLYSVGVLIYEMLAGQPPFIDQLQSAVLVKQATMPPPPLVAKCADAPRRLALVTHGLLAKNPKDRPASAREVRTLLERSLSHPAHVVAEPEPFSSTIATLNTRSSLASRMVAATTVLAILCGLLFIWSRSTTNAHADALPSVVARENPARINNSTTASPVEVASDYTAGHAPQFLEASLSTEDARLIAASVAPHSAVSDAQVIRTEHGDAIAAIHDERFEGKTHLFILEPRGANRGYRVAGRVPLDIEGFSGAHWSTEVLDTDGDGYDEVICTGTGARDDAFSRRLVIYVPRTHETYSMRVGADNRESRAVRIKWSANAAGDHAKPFRAALRERALADLPHIKS